MPGALPHPPPVLPGQIRQRVCEGRRGEKEEVDRDHVSVPSVPPFPSPRAAPTSQYNGIEQYWRLIQIYKIKQLPHLIYICPRLTPRSLPAKDP